MIINFTNESGKRERQNERKEKKRYQQKIKNEKKGKQKIKSSKSSDSSKVHMKGMD